MLLVRAEVHDFIDDRGECALWGVGPMTQQGIEQPFLAKFLAIAIEGFRDAIRVKRKDLAGRESAFPDFALPLFEDAENRCGGAQALYAVIAAK